MVLFCDRARVLYANKAFCSLMDLSLQEQMNREFPFTQLFGNDGNHLKRCILQGTPTTLVCTNPTKNQTFTATILPYASDFLCCLFSKHNTPQTSSKKYWAVFSRERVTNNIHLVRREMDVNSTLFDTVAPSLRKCLVDTTNGTECTLDIPFGTLQVDLTSIGQDAPGNDLFLVHWKLNQTTSNMFNIELPLLHAAMKIFFEKSPTRMGIVRLLEDDIEYVLLNAATIGHFEEAPESLKGITAKDAMSAFDLQKWRSHYIQARDTHQPVEWDWESDGSMGKIEFFKVTSVHLSGDVFLFLANHLTQFKNLDSELAEYKTELENKILERTRELQEALQIKSRFLAVMSHEMRTPLSGVLGTMSLLEDTTLTSEQKDLVRITQVCGQQLLSVINDVLDLSKLEENKMTIDSIPFNIRSTLEDSMEVVAFEAHKKGLELVTCIDPHFPETIVGDPGRLRQIIVNLLGNAVKFSVQGEIVLRAKVRKARRRSVYCGPSPDKERKIMQEIEISVEDNGVGIKESEQHKLFQAFTQIDSSHTRRHGGTGLGLSISKKLAELMNGKMSFKSTYGKGSTFSVNLLAELPTQTQITTNLLELDDNDVDMMDDYWSIHGMPEKLFTEKRVLIADLSVVRSTHLAEVLGHWGVEASIVNTAEELNRLADTQPFEHHAAVVDIRFGMEAISKLEAVTFVMLTGYSQNITDQMKKFPVVRQPTRQSRLQETLTQVLLQKERRLSDSAPPKPVPAKQSVINTSLRVLVVEDNMMNQTIIHKLLLSLKLPESQIAMAENGIKAIEAIQQSQFDVVFMDMMMPEMGGIEATEWIRKKYGKRPIIIALTANAFVEDRRKCIEAGMQDVLTKPIRKQELAHILMKYFPQ